MERNQNGGGETPIVFNANIVREKTSYTAQQLRAVIYKLLGFLCEYLFILF